MSRLSIRWRIFYKGVCANVKGNYFLIYMLVGVCLKLIYASRWVPLEDVNTRWSPHVSTTSSVSSLIHLLLEAACSCCKSLIKFHMFPPSAVSVFQGVSFRSV